MFAFVCSYAFLFFQSSTCYNSIGISNNEFEVKNFKFKQKCKNMQNVNSRMHTKHIDNLDYRNSHLCLDFGNLKDTVLYCSTVCTYTVLLYNDVNE